MILIDSDVLITANTKHFSAIDALKIERFEP
jgi:hypothetical protein